MPLGPRGKNTRRSTRENPIECHESRSEELDYYYSVGRDGKLLPVDCKNSYSYAYTGGSQSENHSRGGCTASTTPRFARCCTCCTPTSLVVFLHRMLWNARHYSKALLNRIIIGICAIDDLAKMGNSIASADDHKALIAQEQ